MGVVFTHNLEFFTHVPGALRMEVAQRLRTIRAHKGRTLLQKGSPSTDIYFVVEGEVEVVVDSRDAREVWINTIGPGEMFGEIAILDGGARTATIVALSDIVVVLMRANDFTRCMESSPGAGLWLARRLASAVNRATKRIFELSALSVPARIHCELLRLARAGLPCSSGIEVRPMPTHDEFANRIGSHREAVTRELGALSNMKIIGYDRQKLVVLDLARLEHLARVGD